MTVTSNQNEPLADSNDDMNEAVEDNEDADSLAPSILEARYEKSIKVDSLIQILAIRFRVWK